MSERTWFSSIPRLCFFLECGAFPPLCFACLFLENRKKKSGGEVAALQKKAKPNTNLVIYLIELCEPHQRR